MTATGESSAVEIDCDTAVGARLITVTVVVAGELAKARKVAEVVKLCAPENAVLVACWIS